MKKKKETEQQKKEEEKELTGQELSSDINHWYSFECSPMDIIYGGGIPAGRMVEFFAWESTGKSTIALHICKSFSKYWTARGIKHRILWQEVENTFDKVRALFQDVPLENFRFKETETLEQMGTYIKEACKISKETGMKYLHIVDTTAALQTENELNPVQKKKEDGTFEENPFSGGMMEKPRIFRKVLSHLAKPLASTDGTLIMCNQIYKSIKPFQDDQAPGGGGPRYYCSTRTKLLLQGDEKAKDSNGEDRVVGIKVTLKQIKNKVTNAKQECDIIINGEEGIDKFLTVFNYLYDKSIFRIASGWKYLKIPIEFGKMEDGKYIEPTFKELAFNNPKGLKEQIEVQYPYALDWIDYLIYKQTVDISPLMKIRWIDKVWGYEEKFYGKKVTELTEKEKKVGAALILLEQQEQEDE